mgnify:CR=1 FL=1
MENFRHLYPRGQIFHIFNKSIASFKIFKNLEDKQRFINVLDYYNNAKISESFSKFIKKETNFNCSCLLHIEKESIVKFLAYVIMPDHYHLLLKILKENHFLRFISNVENSYTRFFNLKYNRKGPLWQTSFKSVYISTNEQLLHVSRYIHLNPTTSKLVADPKNWKFSSYKKYLNKDILKNYLTEISINDPKYYQKFVKNHKDYQIKLKIIKKLTLD